jgi:hypothetical protein
MKPKTANRLLLNIYKSILQDFKYFFTLPLLLKHLNLFIYNSITLKRLNKMKFWHSI